MEDISDNEPDMDGLMIPEVCLNVEEDNPLQLGEGNSKEEIPLKDSTEHNGEIVEIDGESRDSHEFNTSNGIDQENTNPGQLPNPYNTEELALFNQEFKGDNQLVHTLKLHCTACNAHLGSAPNKEYKRFVHPLLKVLICKQCYDFYGSGDFDKDEDGSELYCRWCGQGGKVLCCAKCAYVFCQRCIRVNLGKKTLDIVKASEDWTCFACEPEQIIKVRVTCRALYDYVQEERRLAVELKDYGRLKVDHTSCCTFKPKSTPAKRKRTDLSDMVYNPLNNNDEVHRKRKKMKINILSHKSPSVNNKVKSFVPILPKSWETQVEDEVVCTPDLPMLMDDDESSACTSPLPSLLEPPWTNPPALRPISPLSNSDVQFIGQTKVVSTKKTSAESSRGYSLSSLPVLLTTSTHKPLTANNIKKNIVPNLIGLQKSSIKFNNNNTPKLLTTLVKNPRNSAIDITPANLVPGLRFEWFEKATQVTTRVNQNLSMRLCTLSKDQTSATSLEGLANIHNSFQEILSNSINSLMQIRKNLRNDFISGLKKLKLNNEKPLPSPTSKVSETLDDGDVIIVDSTSQNDDKVTGVRAADKRRGYIKVKPVSELVNASVITIPDDTPIVPREIVLENITCPHTSQNTQNQNIQKDNILVGETKDVSESNEPSTETDETLDPETATLIKRAMLESKFEAIVNANDKIRVPVNIPQDLVKRMLAVRVVVETNYHSQSPRPRAGYKPMQITRVEEEDFEQLLSSSIVVNPSKRKPLDDNDELANSHNILDSSEGETDMNDRVKEKDNLIDEDNEKEEDSVHEEGEEDFYGSFNEEPFEIVKDAMQDPQNTDSGIDVDGEHNSNIDMTNCQNNEDKIAE